MRVPMPFHKLIWTVSILLGLATAALADKPVIFFSDMPDGPTTGWESSTTKGAAISIWGRNLGATRGTSYVTVGGVKLTNASSYAEWGSTSSPTTPLGQQRITFWLNSSMPTSGTAPNTTITVTTPEGTSNGIPFHCRALGTNKIYFADDTGSDSRDGLSAANAWKTFSKARQTLKAGDVIYFRSGVYTDLDRTLMEEHSLLTLKLDPGAGNNFNNGSAWKSITLASYPGEMAQVGDGVDTNLHALVYRKAYSDVSTLEYWTFSKFKFVGRQNCFAWYYRPDGQVDRELRIIGNDITTQMAEIGQGIAINPYTNAHGLRIYGNYFHGVGKVNDDDAFGYRVSPIYHGGGHSTLVDIGWNEFTKNNGTCTQVFGHFYQDSMDLLLWHDNYAHDNGRSSIVIGGGDPSSAPPYAFNKEVRIYNNVFSGNLGEVRLTGINRDGEGVPNSGDFYVYNNTFYKNAAGGGIEFWAINMGKMELYNNIIYGGPNCSGLYSSHMGNSDNITGFNNIIYNVPGTIPSWETSTLKNTDPKFIASVPNTLFELQLDPLSPAVSAGKTNPSISLSTDFMGKFRSTPSDIGAFEQSADTSTQIFITGISAQ